MLTAPGSTGRRTTDAPDSSHFNDINTGPVRAHYASENWNNAGDFLWLCQSLLNVIASAEQLPRMLGMPRELFTSRVATAVQPETRFLLGVIQARAGSQPHSSLAAALAATITPACRGSGSAAQAMFQVPAPTTTGVWTP